MTPKPASTAVRWLLTGPDERWRLAASVDMEALRTELAEAMRAGTPVTVQVVVDGAPVPLLVNTAALRTAAVVEPLDGRTGPSN